MMKPWDGYVNDRLRPADVLFLTNRSKVPWHAFEQEENKMRYFMKQRVLCT